MLFYLLLAILLFVLHYAFRPLYYLLKLKLQFGNQCTMQFFPIIGQLGNVKKYFAKYGDTLKGFQLEVNTKPLIKFRLGNFLNQPVISIVDPEYYKSVFIDHQNYSKVTTIGHNQLINKGLVFSEGEKWHQQRTLLNESFCYDKVLLRLPLMNKIVNENLDNWNESDLVMKFSEITGKIVAKSFFQGTETEFLQVVSQIFVDLQQIFFKRPLIMLKQAILGQAAWQVFPSDFEKKIDKQIRDVRFQLEKIIQMRIMQKQLPGEFDEDEKPQIQDFLDTLLDEYLKQEKTKNKIEIDEIIQQFITLYFAGTDTTANLSANCAALFAQYEDAQEEIYQEIKENINGDVTKESLQKLVKLNAFIQEAQRVRNPTVSPFLRQVKVDHKIKDLQLKKGWYVQVGNFFTQSNINFIDDPFTFNYKRWIDKVNPFFNDNGFVYVPFAAGHRNCIGQHMAKMETKVILIKLLLKYKLTLREQPKWDIRFLYTYQPENIVKFEQRQ
ncbi:hypothetical protein pb186bvf_000289 [Paramecium bursaria]